jgi:hypothetical protein
MGCSKAGNTSKGSGKAASSWTNSEVNNMVAYSELTNYTIAYFIHF